MDSEQQVENSESSKTMEEYLDECCEYYMALGVPYEVFWHGDYCALKYYESVYLQRRKINNEEMWMQGFYNYIAQSTTLSNAFRGKGTQPQEYLQKPLDFFPKTEKEEQAEAEAMRKRIVENLNKFKQEWEKQNVAEDSGVRNKYSG